MSDLKDLAREYAALVPEWAQPGMACRDALSCQWRRVENNDGNGWIGSGTTMMIRDDEVAEGSPDDGQVQLLIPAIAAGPDLEDACTLGGLLLGLGDQVRVTSDSGRWYCHAWPKSGLISAVDHETRAEAVIRACIAQAEVEK